MIFQSIILASWYPDESRCLASSMWQKHEIVIGIVIESPETVRCDDSWTRDIRQSPASEACQKNCVSNDLVVVSHVRRF